MAVLFGFLVLTAGIVGVIFNKRLSSSMMKYHPEENRAKMFIVGRIAYVLVGLWMIVMSIVGLRRIL
jgi:hypothetical protein